MRGIGVQTIASGTTGNLSRSKKGAFQKDVLGLFADPTVLAAHDAREGQRTLVIRNHEGCLGELNV